MQRLAGTGVPVPRVFWQEPDPRFLGAPFYLMERIDGRIPDDNPTYHMAGWMTEIAPEERAAIWWSGIENLARIHRLDARTLALLPEPPSGQTPLDGQLAYWDRYLDWISAGRRGHYASPRPASRGSGATSRASASRSRSAGATRASAT
jgi:aminoglycoside phosphotransferase (APT) family kinase protein